MDNTSGHGKASAVPSEVRRWNWGGLLLTWVWGIGNSTYIAFLCFVPFLNIIMPFVLGAKGSEWAWRNRRWKSVEHFRKVQRNWTLAGLIVWLVIPLLAVLIVAGAFTGMKNSGAYRLAFDRVRASGAAVETLGEPVTAGWWVAGNINVTPASGSAAIVIPVSGPRARGKVYAHATKDMGQWRLQRLRLKVDGSDEDIELTPTN
jgi:hypothetical protein